MLNKETMAAAHEAAKELTETQLQIARAMCEDHDRISDPVMVIGTAQIMATNLNTMINMAIETENKS